jgi:hypothetical protein
VPDPSLAITYHTDRTKTEASATLNYLGRTIDEDNLFDQLVFTVFILKV